MRHDKLPLSWQGFDPSNRQGAGGDDRDYPAERVSCGGMGSSDFIGLGCLVRGAPALLAAFRPGWISTKRFGQGQNEIGLTGMIELMKLRIKTVSMKHANRYRQV